MITWPKDVLILALAFILSVLITRLMIFINIKDVPSDRSSHSLVTPRSGGIGIIISFFICMLIQGISHIPFYEDWICLLIMLTTAIVMGFIGLLDDLKGLSSYFRLVMQIGISSFLVLYIGPFQTITIPYIGTISLGVVGIFISILWIVGFINIFNFMDGLNGMAGMVTIVASLFLAIIAANLQNDLQIHLILISSTLGFLVFNFPKARIFLGDSGSMFLGYYFAAWGLLSIHPNFGGFSIWVFPLLFFIYLYDTILTRLRRMLAGKPFFDAHREHLYQLLHQSGWSHARVTCLYVFIFILQGIASVFMVRMPERVHFLFFIPFLISVIPFTWWIFKRAQKAGIEY